MNSKRVIVQQKRPEARTLDVGKISCTITGSPDACYHREVLSKASQTFGSISRSELSRDCAVAFSQTSINAEVNDLLSRQN